MTPKTLILGGKKHKIVPKSRYSMIFNESENAKNIKKHQKSSIFVNFCQIFQKSSFFMKNRQFLSLFQKCPKIVKNPGGVKKKYPENWKGQKSRRKRRLKNGFWPVCGGPPGVRKWVLPGTPYLLRFLGVFKTGPKTVIFWGVKKNRIFDDFLTFFDIFWDFGDFWTFLNKKRV